MIKSYLKRNARDNFIKIVICGLFFTVITSFMSYSLYTSLHNSFEEQVHQNLSDLAEENAEQLSKDMTAKINVLHTLATIVNNSTENNTAILMSRMQEINGIYNLKRIGFVYPDGKAYTTDGFVRNLKFRDFFRQSIAGKVFIQHRFIDSLGIEEPVNVISVPVIAPNGNIKGVLFGTYKTSVFHKIMDLSLFNGQGHSTIINLNGDILVTSTNGRLSNENNLFEALVKNQSGTEFIQALLKDMSSYKTGKLDLQNKDENIIIHYQPIKLGNQTWYLLTSVPSTVAYEHISPIVNKVNMFFIAAIFLLILLSSYVVWNYARHKNRISTLAYTDTLTNEGNFSSIKEVYTKLNFTPKYLVAMDIARFSLVTMDQGRDRINYILLEIWKLIKQSLGPKDMACHAEHDEFILCIGKASQEELEEQLHHIKLSIQELSKRIGIPSLSSYFGVVELKPNDNLEQRLCEALQAKHEAKKNKFNSVGYYSEANSKALHEREALLAAIPEALENNRFEVWYQPKFSATSGAFVGAEALVRWRDKKGDLIPPYKFIRLMEKNGFISAMDEYMFTHVCQQQQNWLQQGKKICMVSVNLSRISLFSGDIVERYSSLIKDIGLDTQYIGIEITEGAIANKEEIVEPLKRFHLQGFKLLLDDFGSGYSSLSSFYMLPIDIVKFDKSLIDHICDANGYNLIEGMVKFIDGLKMSITAEGVETQEQVEKLQQMNCSRIDIQGYVYAKPMPAAEFEAKYLQNNNNEKN